MPKHEEAKEAEELAVEHMRRLGLTKAKRGRTGPDGGVDITAPGAIAQVKDKRAKTPEGDIRNLNGSGHPNTSKLFYSASGYSAPAVEFADDYGIALFKFELATRTVTPVGALAWNLVHQADDPGLTEFSAEPPTTTPPRIGGEQRTVHVEMTNPARLFDFPEHVPSEAFPDEVIPFAVGPEQVDQAFREWAGREALATGDFRKRVTAGNRRAVYLPYWTGHVQLYSNYRGKIGLFDQGHKGQRTTRWSPAQGQVVHRPVEFLEPAFDPGSTLGATAKPWLDEIRKSWELSQALFYRPDLVAAQEGLRHSVTPEAVVTEVRNSQRKQIAKDIRAHIDGDAQEVSWCDVGDIAIHCRLVLVPVWVVDWSFSGKSGTVLINGQSGKAAGKSITSVAKTLALIIGGASLVALCCAGAYLVGNDPDQVKGTEEITRDTYELQGKTWPFTSNEALLTCYDGRSITATVDGKVYFLAPVEDDELELAETENWQDAATILVDDDSFLPLSDVTADAKSACWN